MEVADSNPRIICRRKSSFVDHINRIREANLKRQISLPWENLKSINPRKVSLTSDVNSNRKLHAASIPIEPFDNFFSNAPKSKNSNDSFITSSKNTISLDSVKRDRIQQPAAILKPKITPEKESTSQERRNIENAMAKISTQSKAAEKNSTRVKAKQKPPKASTSLKSASKRLKKKPDQEKDDDKSVLSEENPQSHNYRNRQMSTDVTQELMNYKGSPTSKDVIVLNWLHELNCPKSEESKLRENSMTNEVNKRFPIRILKKPLSQDFTERKAAIRKVPDSVLKIKGTRTKEKAKKVKTKPLRSGERIKTKPKNKDHYKKVEISNEAAKSSDSESTESSKDKLKKSINTTMDSQIKESVGAEEKKKSATSDESCKRLDNIEINISDLGKLQIVLDLKLLSTDDAAVLIWLDDLPKSAKEANLRTSALNEKKTSVKSDSALELEDVVSPRPNINFPSVTILKNLAVDSKVGLRTLNDDFSDSVYYRRCNINHVES